MGEGLQDVLVLSRRRPEVFQGHQLLTFSQAPWVLPGSRRPRPPCTHRHPKPPPGVVSLGKQFPFHLCS